MITLTSTRPVSAAARRRPLGLRARLRHALELRRQRQDLARLDAHLLRDIGIDDTRRAAELRKPVWSAPEHWRR